MRSHLLLLLSLISIPAAPNAQELGAIEIRLPGVDLSFEQKPHLNGLWLAVVRNRIGFSLAKTTLRARSVPDACAGTATRIEAPGAEGAILLIRGLPQLAEGPVDSVFHGFLAFGEVTQVALRPGSGSEFRLSFLPNPSPGTDHIYYHRLELFRDGNTQVLSLFGQETRPALLWAGDLDRDGAPDLLFDEGGGNRNYVLYLSSPARNGAQVQRVAEFSMPAC